MDEPEKPADDLRRNLITLTEVPAEDRPKSCPILGFIPVELLPQPVARPIGACHSPDGRSQA